MGDNLIIGPGGPRDRRSLPLATKLGNYIPNVQRPEIHNAEIRRASVDAFTKLQPTLRSWSVTYNCMGLVFASRRTHVDIEHLRFILREDGYRRLPHPDAAELGDVVVYTKTDPEHVGLIAEIKVDLEKGLRDLWVISKWGRDGEYLHKLHNVPPLLGTPTEYWTDRR